MATQDSMDTEQGLSAEEGIELIWLREQYSLLKQSNDSLRQAYSTAGQEAAAHRRAISTRAPTSRERAAIAALPYCLALVPCDITDDEIVENIAVNRAVRLADHLLERLANG